MLAMQYSFTFPADYDMSIIRKRITERGGQLDGYPDMHWKAYLWTERNPENQPAHNTYAPFYLWHCNDGMNRFLNSPGFQNLCHDFGRPEIETWSVTNYMLAGDLKSAKFLHRQIDPIAPGRMLADLQLEESAFANAALAAGAVSVVTAFDPLRWRALRVTTWAQPPAMHRRDDPYDDYNIGYVALGHP